MENKSYKKTLDNVMLIGKHMQFLSKKAVLTYSAEVNVIITSKSRDTKQIERTLEGMLDFCFDEDMLCLYKKLCRYYYGIDQTATVYYVNSYRELWDTDSIEKLVN